MVCTLHIDTRLEKRELRTLVAEVTAGTIAHGTVHTAWGDVGVGDDLRSYVARDPDDFLNWPYYLDTYPGESVSEEDFLKGIYQLRNRLVESGVRVWIVTDIEHTFPPGWTPDR